MNITLRLRNALPCERVATLLLAAAREDEHGGNGSEHECIDEQHCHARVRAKDLHRAERRQAA